jgi:hypothetical protein
MMMSSFYRMKRALKSVKLEEDAKVTLADFVSLNDKFPAIFIPAFLLQNSLRNKVYDLLVK